MANEAMKHLIDEMNTPRRTYRGCVDDAGKTTIIFAGNDHQDLIDAMEDLIVNLADERTRKSFEKSSVG